jgi:predicted nucleic acid-binding protein
MFVDTGPLIPRHLARDQFHQRAVAAWKELGTNNERLYTSNLVLAETFTLLGRRAGYAFAAERAHHLLQSERLVILRPGETDEWSALAFFEQFADQAVSFTDCVSFALMRKHRIKRAFAFDRHFKDAGFKVWPAT